MDASLRSRAEQLASEMASQAATVEVLNGLMRLMMKSALERMLNTEMDVHPRRRPSVVPDAAAPVGETPATPEPAVPITMAGFESSPFAVEPIGRMAGFGSGPGATVTVAEFESPEPVSTLADFDPDNWRRRYLPTIARSMPSSRAIRRCVQPCANNHNRDCTFAILSTCTFAITGTYDADLARSRFPLWAAVR